MLLAIGLNFVSFSINTGIAQNGDRDSDEPDTNEHQLESICDFLIHVLVVASKNKMVLQRTAQEESWWIPRPVYISCDGSTEIPDSYVNSHANTTFILSSKIVPKPMQDNL